MMVTTAGQVSAEEDWGYKNPVKREEILTLISSICTHPSQILTRNEKVAPSELNERLRKLAVLASKQSKLDLLSGKLALVAAICRSVGSQPNEQVLIFCHLQQVQRYIKMDFCWLVFT
jgi:hypothetical protein